MTIGFIKLHRRLLEWEWYSDINTTRVFIHLLVSANYENKKWRGIDISRGQLITSLANLAKSTTLSLQQTRTALTKLKSTHEITVRATKLHTFVTLTNYNLYQDRIIESNTPTNTPLNISVTDEQHRSNIEATTTKEEKNIRSKEVKKIKEDLLIELENLGVDAETWNGFVETRNLKKKPLTDKALKLIMNKLNKFEITTIGFAKLSLENAIEGSWTTIHEPKTNTNKPTTDSREDFFKDWANT